MRRPMLKTKLASWFGLAASVAMAASGVELKLAHLAPDGSLWDKAIEEMGAEWRRRSNGQVSLKIYPGMVAGPDDTVVRKLRHGQLHAAALSYIGLTAIDDAFEIFPVPRFYDSYEEYFYVLDKLEPVLEQRLEDKGLVLLNWGLVGWAHFFTKKPVAKVDDLKGMRIFTAAGDPEMVHIYQRNGYHPVALASTDVITGLQTGMIDALPTTPTLALATQWYRRIPYMHEFGLGPVVGATVITKKAWQRVPEAIRSDLLKAARKSEKRLYSEIPRLEIDAIAEMKKRGLEVTASDDLEEWQREADHFIHSMRGTIVPADIFDLAIAARSSYRQQLATTHESEQVGTKSPNP